MNSYSSVKGPAQMLPSLSGFLGPCLCECTLQVSLDMTRGLKGWLSLAQVLAVPGRDRAPLATPNLAEAPHLEVGEVLLHEAIDLAHRQASCLAVLQGHGDQTAGGTMWGRPDVKASQADSPRSPLPGSWPCLTPLVPAPRHSQC